MRDKTIARNYASALLELANREGAADAYAVAFHELAMLLGGDRRVRQFLETPAVDAAPKQTVLRRALEGRVPEMFLRFVLVVVEKRRQHLLSEIEAEYQTLLDEQEGRLHAEVTLARRPDTTLEREIAGRLSALLGKSVIPHVIVNPAILGGLVVRYGDRCMDGSLRRQLLSLKREMMHAVVSGLPATSA